VLEHDQYVVRHFGDLQVTQDQFSSPCGVTTGPLAGLYCSLDPLSLSDNFSQSQRAFCADLLPDGDASDLGVCPKAGGMA
jgi:hypothetical protein